VSLGPIFVLPPGVGDRGSKENMKTALAGFSLLYPPCESILVGTAHPTRWIPASAGMTEKVQEKLLSGVRGCPSVPYLFFPQEWGTKGVERVFLLRGKVALS